MLPHFPPNESDPVDRINARALRANTALASSLVWWLAESPQRFGRRLTRAEVGKLLSDTKLDAQMKAFAQWEDYQSGKRGVNKTVSPRGTLGPPLVSPVARNRRISRTRAGSGAPD